MLIHCLGSVPLRALLVISLQVGRARTSAVNQQDQCMPCTVRLEMLPSCSTFWC
jgi:hypothetical protein